MAINNEAEQLKRAYMDAMRRGRNFDINKWKLNKERNKRKR
jgi:hypothetical protein